MTPFRITFSDAELEDLRSRLINTKYPDDIDNDDWKYGTNRTYLQELVRYWIDEYDWRAEEAKINAFQHFRTMIDGTPIHFIREPGKGPKPMPLILSHGWPWTFWDYHRVIRPLADPASFGGDPMDAFEVIVPSMPGFGFSTPVPRPGINFWRTADIWHELMTNMLGFQRYGAQGGDWGALTTEQLGHKYHDSLYGIHVTLLSPLSLFNGERPWDVTGGAMVPKNLSPEERASYIAWQERIVSHVAVQVVDPQTLSYGIHDSPVGLLAWMLERRRAWSACNGDVESIFDRDFLITTTMLYWISNSFVSSARFYADAARYHWKPANDRTPLITAPAGISYMRGDGTAGIHAGQEHLFKEIVYTAERTEGHFGPSEGPESIIEDIRATFRGLRDR